MPNLETLELEKFNIPDGFFLALKTSASEARLELIRHYGKLDISAAASEAYAKSICTMPNLETLELEEFKIADGFFLALKTSASEARLELIRHYGKLDISAAASEAYAKSICTMPNLETLELEKFNIPDGFFLALKTSASEARLELIRHYGKLDISAAASEAYAKSICTMPNLETLELEKFNIPDGFFLALKTSASEARLESIKHSGGLDISPAASEAYAKSICTMPNLKTLELEEVNIADGFFLALKTSASEARLESIRHCGGPFISAAALQAYAQSISTMPNLRDLELKNVIIADNISVCLTTSTLTIGGGTSKTPLYSTSQFLSLCQHEGSDISAATWQALVQFICAVSHLLSLERAYIGHHQHQASPFLSGVKRRSKKELSMELATISIVGSRALAEIICTMPNLRTLELEDARITDDFYLTLAELASRTKIQRLVLSGMSISTICWCDKGAPVVDTSQDTVCQGLGHAQNFFTGGSRGVVGRGTRRTPIGDPNRQHIASNSNTGISQYPLVL
ncbi:uncharacterized protein [Diadema antillarum]|uniref:uncharacterized protein n=1 Tax=Diadema antillarum TaxID=105358 RepID=UPI003A87E267